MLSGVSVRNIRAYRERGLLDAPRRQGRSAYYDDRHLSQLRTVNELLRKGFTSAHIAEFLSSTRQGHDLADILGLQQAVFGEPRHAAAIDVDVDPDGVEARRLVGHGLAEVVDGTLRLADSDLAEILGRVDDPVPYVEAILRVADGIADRLDELAKVVVAALEVSLFAGFARDSVPRAEDVAALRQRVDDHHVLGRLVVADQFDDALQRHLVSAVSEYTADVALGGHREPEER